jgi:hypothetical protein
VHGGSVKARAGPTFAEEGWFQVTHGHKISFYPNGGEERELGQHCPEPLCVRTHPLQLHIYHYRSPSLQDALEKRAEDNGMAIELTEELERQLLKEYDFYNQIRDTTLAAKFHYRLATRIHELMV